jgi:hypothetical protein
VGADEPGTAGNQHLHAYLQLQAQP